MIDSADLPAIIKNALSHYWGGPKLTDSPLMRLRIVKKALREHNGNATNALRAVLQQAIERIKPEGQRKFTADWVLYNILEMKFLQNRRVREVALRLAVSEADLYRKQRAAIESATDVFPDPFGHISALQLRRVRGMRCHQAVGKVPKGAQSRL